MRILMIFSDAAGCAWYRVFTPADALIQAGHQVTVCHIDNPLAWAHDEEVAVIQKQHQPKGVNLVMEKRARGIYTVGEVDDNYWDIPHDNQAAITFHHWSVNESEQQLRKEGKLDPNTKLIRPLTILEYFFRAVDAVTVPTYPLLAAMRRFNKNVHVLPNCINDVYLPVPLWPTPPEKYRQTRVLWTGSHSHRHDIPPMWAALLKLCKEDPSVRFVQLGNFDREMEPFPPRGREYYPPLQFVNDYLTFLTKVTCHIGLGPLEPTTFNKSKSSIKSLEYGMAGAYPLMQDWAPYQNNDVLSRVAPLVAKNTEKCWYDRVKMAASDAEGTRELAYRWQDRVKANHTITRNIWRWAGLYESLAGHGPRSKFVPHAMPQEEKQLQVKKDWSIR